MDATKLATSEKGAAPVQSSKICWDQFVEITRVRPEMLREFVETDWLCAEKTAQGEYLFASQDVTRICKAARLSRDLELTVAGVTIIIDLLNRVEALENEVRNLREKS